MARPVIAGLGTVAGYLGVVILTTPALEPAAAINAALGLNAIVIFGMGLGMGLQIFLSDKRRQLGCSTSSARRAIGGNSGSAAATSFFSFFSLVPLGCCGWWLYILSLLPSVIGTGLSAALIQYSGPLAYAALAAVFGLNAVTAYRIYGTGAKR